MKLGNFWSKYSQICNIVLRWTFIEYKDYCHILKNKLFTLIFLWIGNVHTFLVWIPTILLTGKFDFPSQAIAKANRTVFAKMLNQILLVIFMYVADPSHSYIILYRIYRYIYIGIRSCDGVMQTLFRLTFI